MRKLIRVEQKHINSATGGSDNCPVALALKDAGFEEVSVLHYYIRLGWSVTLPPSRSVQRFVRKFDHYGKSAVQPFNFYLNVPDSFLTN